MTPALQVTDSYSSWDAAYGALCAQRGMDLYLGGRVYQRDGRWHMQAFHAPEDAGPSTWLPDGMRYVLVPRGLALSLGFAH